MGYSVPDAVRQAAPAMLAGYATTSAKKLALEHILGIVYFACPALNTYAVLPAAGSATGMIILASGERKGSTGRYGVRSSSHYLPGSLVIVARAPIPESIAVDMFSKVYAGWIVSGAPTQPANLPYGFPPNTLFNSPIDYSNECITDVYHSRAKDISPLAADMSQGLPYDIMPGDYLQQGSLLNRVHMGVMGALVQASPMASVEAYTLYDKVRIMAATMEHYSKLSEDGWYPDKASMQFYARRAFSLQEGLGAIDGVPPLLADGDTAMQPVAAGQAGVFRREALEGYIADGRWDYVLSPEKAGDGGVRTGANLADSAPVGLLSERTYYDGSRELRSAGGFSLVKSSYVPVPCRLKDEDAAAFALADAPDPVPYEDSDELPDYVKDRYNDYAACREYDEHGWNRDNFRNRRIRARSAYWKLHTRDGVSTALDDLDLINAPRELAVLGADETEYPEPAYVTVKDPVTELERRLYALESVLRILPDGTVAISDGHGSELRMYRGNITLSPAADLRLMPGRDTIEMTPRTRVINAVGDVYIQSARASVNMKAEKSMRLLAANSGRGYMLIESRGVNDSDDPIDTDRTLRKGLLLKSSSYAGLVGADLYVGIFDAEAAIGAQPEHGLARTAQGTMVLDACGGMMAMFGDTGYGRFKTRYAVAGGDTVLHMAAGVTQVLGTALEVTGDIRFAGASSGSVQLPVIAEGGIENETVTVATGMGNVHIKGDMRVEGSMALARMLQAQSVSAQTGGFNNAKRDTGLHAGYTPPKAAVTPVTVAGGPLVSFTGIGSGVDVLPGYTGKGVCGMSYAYPTTKAVHAEKLKIGAARWQHMLSAGAEWDEPPVVDRGTGADTYVWPGEQHWTGALSAIGTLYDGEQGFAHYITNT